MSHSLLKQIETALRSPAAWPGYLAWFGGIAWFVDKWGDVEFAAGKMSFHTSGPLLLLLGSLAYLFVEVRLSINRQLQESLRSLTIGFQHDYSPGDQMSRLYLVPSVKGHASVRIRVVAMTGTTEAPWTVPWTDATLGDADIGERSAERLRFCQIESSPEEMDERRAAIFSFHREKNHDLVLRVPTQDMRRLSQAWELKFQLRAESGSHSAERNFLVWLRSDMTLDHQRL